MTLPHKSCTVQIIIKKMPQKLDAEVRRNDLRNGIMHQTTQLETAQGGNGGLCLDSGPQTWSG